MGERKVINKYYPADFDPSKIPRRVQPKNRQMVVRMMLPMTVRCAACARRVPRQGHQVQLPEGGRRRREVPGRHPGLRFYIRCSRCSSEIVFKTDPKNADYALETGASRATSEPWRAASAAAEEEEGDAMRALENRSRDTRREMRSLRSRRAGVTPDQLLESLHHRRRQTDHAGYRKALDEQLEEDDEKLISSITFGNAKDYLKWIDDKDDDEEYFFESCLTRAAMASH